MAEPCISESMSIAPSWTPSRRMQAAASAERERIEREIRRLRDREEDLRRDLAATEARRRGWEHELELLARFAENDEPTHRAHLRVLPEAEPGVRVLKGS